MNNETQQSSSRALFIKDVKEKTGNLGAGGSTVFSIRITTEQFKELNEKAQALGLTKNSLVQYSINQLLQTFKF
jgi:hypothetical protein